jgi:hypothetical protein
LVPTESGKRKYIEYLGWLAENEPEKQRQQFDRMSRGWIIGTKEFGQAMLLEQRELAARGPQLANELNLFKEASWEEALRAALRRARRAHDDLRNGTKSAAWKLRLAAELRRTTTVTNRWLGVQLHLGARDEVSRKLSAWLRDHL